MGRIVAGWMAIIVGASLVNFAAAQTHEPRGLTFSQGGGYHYAPREHHVTVQGWPGYSAYGVGYPNGYYYGGYPVGYGAYVTSGYYWPQPLPMSQIPNSPLAAPVRALPAQVGPWADLPGPKVDPVERPVLPSSAAAKLKSLNYQADGDQNVRQQLWQRAYVNYRQAVNVADDQAMAHLRYGIVFAVLRRYDRAELEFKRAVYIDPSLPNGEFTLEKLFGPDSKAVRSSILARIADWVNEDIADTQRLFVMGVLLHFNQDERAQDLFSAAHQLSGGAAHITAFLPRTNRPANNDAPQPDGALPFPPAPLPEAPLPPAPQPMTTKRPARVIEAPPAPGLDVDAPAKPAPVKPASQIPVKPATPDGPVLLPPSPDR